MKKIIKDLRINEMFRFNLSVSTKPYDRNKDEKRTGSLEWRETSTTVDELKDFVLHNYAFCNCFYHNTPTFANSEKTQHNFKESNLIILDFDAVKYNINDFWKLMSETEIVPNLVYTSANNGVFKKPQDKYPNRYRVVYVLDNAIANSSLYSSLVYSLKNEIALMCDDGCVMSDMSDRDCSHLFAGNNNAMSYVQCNAISLNFLIERYDLGTVQFPSLLIERGGKVIMKETGHPKETKKFSDEAFGNAWENQKSDIRLLYDFSEYHTYTTTPIEWNENELYRYVSDMNIYDLSRRWKNITDPITHKKYSTIVRYKYGEHRRKKIWTALVIRRLIDPTITLEQLCYAAVYELYNYIDNTDKKHFITRRNLKHIAEEVLECEIQNFKNNYRINKKYMINKMERIRRGMSVTDVMTMVKTEEKTKNYKQLSEKYDATLSVRQNAEILGVSNGTVQSIKKWLQEQKKKEVEQLPTNDEKTRQNANKYPQIEEESNMDNMCCEDMIRDMYRIIKNTFEPQIKKPEKMDLSWMKNAMNHQKK